MDLGISFGDSFGGQPIPLVNELLTSSTKTAQFFSLEMLAILIRPRLERCFGLRFWRAGVVGMLRGPFAFAFLRDIDFED